MHNAGPLCTTLLIGASIGYFMSDFQTQLTLTSVIGYGGGFLVSLVECALVFKKRLASRAGDDEQATRLLLASLAFGFVSVITQIVFLEKFLNNPNTDILTQLPVLGVVIGAMGGNTFLVVARGCIYHATLYASAWLLSGSRPSISKQLEWQERQLLHQRAQQQFMTTMQQQPSAALNDDVLKLVRELQQQVAALQRQADDVQIIAANPEDIAPRRAPFRPAHNGANHRGNPGPEPAAQGPA